MKVYEKQLKFSGKEGHAIIVDFNLDYRLIFWSKANYAGCWDLGNSVWFTPEWLETSSTENFHCYEPIMDKKLKYSSVKIIEANKARVKVLWRYACNDMRYRIFHGNTFAEEIYTVYPDGIGVRKLTAYPGDESSFGGNPNMWQVLEWIVIHGKGITPDMIYPKKNAFTLLNRNGESISLDWPIQFDEYQPLCEPFPQIAKWDSYIGKVNILDRPNPFVIIKKDQRLFPYRHCSCCNGDHPMFGLFGGISNVYKHWPASESEDFIIGELGSEEAGKVATQSSFVDCNYTRRPDLAANKDSIEAAQYYVETPPRGASWLFLTGATYKEQDYLTKLAQSWFEPAKVLTGNEYSDGFYGMSSGPLIYEGYAFSERAYTFRKFEKDDIKFTIYPKNPIINPVFIINGWKSPNAFVKINGMNINSKSLIFDINGDDLILILIGEFNKECLIEISS